MNPVLIAELLKFVLPLVRQIQEEWKAAHNGAEPTDAQILDHYFADIDRYLAEGAAWRATHPK